MKTQFTLTRSCNENVEMIEIEEVDEFIEKESFTHSILFCVFRDHLISAKLSCFNEFREVLKSKF